MTVDPLLSHPTPVFSSKALVRVYNGFMPSGEKYNPRFLLLLHTQF